MIQAYFKGKLVIQDNCIKQNEDLKTSSSIGLLQYLPDDIFWNIMRNCCVGFNIEDFGKILALNEILNLDLVHLNEFHHVLCLNLLENLHPFSFKVINLFY